MNFAFDWALKNNYLSIYQIELGSSIQIPEEKFEENPRKCFDQLRGEQWGKNLYLKELE